MAFRQLEEFVELNLRQLKELLTPSLPNVVLCDLQITKIHDSLPMALYRFTHIAPIRNGSVADSDTTRKYCPWFAFFLPWSLFHEIVFHPRAYTLMRLT
jgi:hypothetical protein